jgi:hypothetical protein
MVSVGQNGRVKDVQVTSGGFNYRPGYDFAIWDTRMSKHMRGHSDCDGSKPCYCTFHIPDSVTGSAIQTAANDVFLHASARVGAVSALAAENQCVVITAGADANICGTGFGANKAHGFRAALVHNDATAGAEKKTLDGVYVDGYCNSNDGTLDAAIIVGAGAADCSSDVDYPKSVADAIAVKTLLGSANTMPGTPSSGTADVLDLTIQPNCANDFYWQFGMYDTVTPRFHIDPIHEGVDPAQPLQKHHFVSIMGMKHYTHIPLDPAATTDKHTGWGGQTADRRESFSDILTNTYGAGYANTPDHPTDVSAIVTPATTALIAGAASAKLTASVIVGENGVDAILSKVVNTYGGTLSREFGLGAIIEHPEKYAYIGRGYDELTVTPVPDLMSGKKAIITFQGPKGGCSVTEVDRGTHESAECSGRGNCDRETGTCICDAGYTLEACSEQTVLV